MRVIAIALIGIGCGSATTGPARSEDTGRRRNSLHQETPPPPEPPPLASVLGCWALDEARDDVHTWICLGAYELAIEGTGGWNAWPHAGWQRDDTFARAGWSTMLRDGRTVWLTVVESVVEGPAVHVSDGSGLAARLVHAGSDPTAHITAERAALPTVDEVCDAARACLAAIPPAPVPAAEIEAEIEIDAAPEPPPLTGVVTLRDCDAAWVRAAEEVRRAFAPAPPECARPVDRVWWQELERPYPPIDSQWR